MQRSNVLLILSLVAISAVAASAHPGSGITLDAQGQLYFVDTGQGVWKIDTQGRLSLFHTLAYHWMALDEKGHFARSSALGSFDRGSFERITPTGSIPTLVISSDYPIAVGQDGALYYVPYKKEGPRQVIRKMPDGTRSVLATLPTDAGDNAIQWINGIACGPEGWLYVTDNDAVRKIDRKGAVTTVRGGIQLPDCSPDPLPDTPKGPYLRGLAVHSNGSIYVAANGCRAVIQISREGAIKTILKAQNPWSPTGVALSGADIYVLEYIHTTGDNRKEWIPRVRKVASDGKVSTVATVNRQTN